MSIKLIALTCALLAICVSYLPSGNGQACTAPDTPAGCTDCALAENVNSPDCATTTTAAAPTTTVAAGTDTTTAAAGTDTTTTTAAPGKGGKIRIKRKFKIVRKPGKKIIKRRRNGTGKKGIFGKSSNNRRGGRRSSSSNRKTKKITRRRRSG